MGRFVAVEMEGATHATRWSIVEIVPGEKPIPVSFFGRKAEAEAEAHRLNLYGRSKS
jgi:hypothetical protein